MKEKLLQLKEKIMQNKKKAVAIGIAALLLIGAGGYGIVVWVDGSNDETAKIEKCELEENQADKKVVKKDETDKKSEKADADKEKDKKESSSDKKETKKTEPVKEDEKKQDSKNSGTKTASTDNVSGSTGKAKPSANSTSGAGTVKAESNTQPSAPDPEPTPTPQPQPESKPESNSKPEPPAHVHDYSIPITTQQWVVDQPAWTETVNEPVYDMVEIAVGNQSGIVITGDPNEYLLNNTNGDTGWHSEWIQQQTGTNTYTVEHPEQGHNETVTTGYKCSCGAVQ